MSHVELPQNDEAERSVLGAVLVDNRHLDEVSDILRPDDFYRAPHQRIFRSMLEMAQDSLPIDVLTLGERHVGDSVIDAVGGVAFLSRLMDGIPKLVNVRHYASIVRDRAIRRQLVRAASELGAEAALGESEVQDVLGSAARRIADIGERHLQQGLVPMKELLETSLDDIEKRQGIDSTITGVPTGFGELDELTSGLQKGDLIILAARPSMGKCVAWDTPIIDADSGAIVTVQELHARGVRGERVRVLTLTPEGRLEATTPSAFVDDGVKPVFRVRTRLGRGVATTASHPFLTGAGWKPLHDLRVGVRIAVPRTLPVAGDEEMPEHEVVLLALLLGDGNLTGRTARFTTTSELLRQEATRCASLMGVAVTAQRHPERAPSYSFVTPRGHANGVTDLLRKHGLMGHGAATKRVPPAVFRLPLRQLATFLNRLHATDGCAWVAGSYGRIAYCSVSEQLARDVQHLLLRFGINAKLRRRSVPYRDERRPAYEVEILAAPDILRFDDAIGILGKEEALGRLAELARRKRRGWTKDTLPIEIWDGLDAARGDRSWSELAREAGKGPGFNWHVRRRQPRRETVATLAAVLDSPELAAAASSDVLWDEIVAIEPRGEQQVYDLTIPTTHNFVAGDIVVHNTALAMSMAQNAAIRSEKRIAVFSLEMSAVQLAMRMLCAEARVDAQKMRRGQLTDLHWNKLMKAFTRLAAAPIFIDETSAITVQEMRAKAKRLQQDRGLDCIIVDYLQLMGSSDRIENRQQEISAISRGLKKLAHDLKVPVIALSQLSRAPDQRQGDHRPMLSDLRESGSLEQDADVVMFIFREEVYKIREGKDPGDKRGVAEVIIGKQRNGPVDTVKLAFIKEWTRFENLQREGPGGGSASPASEPEPDDVTPF